ncbi:hypothetical protein DdX_06593 [Ditylenchus destructor]|uniref:Uncharacterized protein n=1 Tax=Ditylenchus destructor TaxID=166010 RepID=A0AAD4R992_9BILA|nr:hypothetical protein DdX_06593 [Ditylenchus destructor]
MGVFKWTAAGWGGAGPPICGVTKDYTLGKAREMLEGDGCAEKSLENHKAKEPGWVFPRKAQTQQRLSIQKSREIHRTGGFQSFSSEEGGVEPDSRSLDFQ